MFEQPTPPENKKHAFLRATSKGNRDFYVRMGIVRDFSATKMKKVLENQGLFFGGERGIQNLYLACGQVIDFN